MRSEAEAAVGIADALREAGGAIFRDIGVHPRSARDQRRLHVGDDGQGLVLDGDQVDGVLGDVAVLRHHERDGLANEAHLVLRQRPLGTRVGQVRMRDQERPRLVQIAEVGRGDHEMHAGDGPGAGGVDGANPGVGVRAPETRRVEDAGRAHVVDKGREAAEKPRILVPHDSRADHPRGHGVPARSRHVSAASRTLARRTARTMFW